MPAGAGVAVARNKANKRAKNLAAKLDEKNAEIDEWFAKYDADESGNIDREEGAKLLTQIKRDMVNDKAAPAVDDATLDVIFSKYADPNTGNIERERILNVVKAYKAFVSDELHYKDLFAKYDKDASATLTKEELLPLLREVAPPPYKQAEEGDVEFVLTRYVRSTAAAVSTNCEGARQFVLTVLTQRAAVCAQVRHRRQRRD